MICLSCIKSLPIAVVVANGNSIFYSDFVRCSPFAIREHDEYYHSADLNWHITIAISP